MTTHLRLYVRWRLADRTGFGVLVKRDAVLGVAVYVVAWLPERQREILELPALVADRELTVHDHLGGGKDGKTKEVGRAEVTAFDVFRGA